MNNGPLIFNEMLVSLRVNFVNSRLYNQVRQCYESHGRFHTEQRVAVPEIFQKSKHPNLGGGGG